MTGRLLASVVAAAALAALAACSQHTMDRYTDRYGASRQQDRVDINSASAKQLERLPGLDADDASRIVANSPYPNTEALVRRGVIGPGKYDRIEDYVYAGGSRRQPATDQGDRYYQDRR